MILLLSFIPLGFRYNYVVPIPEPKEFHKSLACNDFRGISISLVICKVFENCIIEQFGSFFTASDNQFRIKNFLIVIMLLVQSQTFGWLHQRWHLVVSPLLNFKPVWIFEKSVVMGGLWGSNDDTCEIIWQCNCKLSRFIYNKMLSYRREIALQGALVLAKSGRMAWDTIFCRLYRFILNHCDIIGL